MNNLKKAAFKDKFEKWFKWFRIAYLIIPPVYILVLLFYKGAPTYAEPKSIQSLIIGFVVAFIVLILLLFADIGFSAWDKSTTWLAKFLRKYPLMRRIVLIPIAVATPILGVNISFLHWQLDDISRVIFFAYTVIIFPAAMLSIIKDEKVREHVRLSKQITPELIANNPQAAIENAFTYFEDHLRKRLGVGADVFSEALINLAYGQDGRLTYGDVENENKGARNFISGAYATFRNPRKHRIIKDDEQTTFIVISIIEMLVKIVDESKDRGSTSGKVKT